MLLNEMDSLLTHVKTFLKGLREYHTIASRDYFTCVSISVSENMSPEDILFSIEIYLDLVID